jgi:hypothetical protein
LNRLIGGCALLHGQGRSFVPYKKNVGFFTVWKTFLDFSWDDVLSKRAELVIEKVILVLNFKEAKAFNTLIT